MVAAGIFVASLLTLACGKPVSRLMQRHDVRSDVPSGFVQGGPASPDTMLKMRLALVQSDPDGLVKALYDVSTPGSALYGQHLTREEAAAFAAPTSETQQVVNAWLAENDITATPLTPAGDWLSFSVPASKANELFDADFTVFTHESTGKQAIRTLAYSLPADLQGHIDFVHPTTVFPQFKLNRAVSFKPLKKNLTERALPASCASEVTPSCLQELYGIPTAAATQSSNKIGVSGFIEEFANQADLKEFLENFRPDISSSTTFTVADVDGGSNPQSRDEAGLEANLDTQYTVGIATGVPNVFISVGEDNTDGIDGFLDEINFLLGESPPPQVLSTSYSFNEPELPFSLANNLCNAYAQLGAVGTSILFSSGDGGVSGGQSESCTTFVPTFPSTCPFVTSVGATQGSSPEVAASFSSGGFSTLFAIPSYQADDVSSFLSSIGNTNSGKFNSSGRAFPDISAQGVDVVIVFEGETGTVDGTSCSTPISASIIALVNDKLAAAGKPPLGFLNPLFYANPSVFTDITSGDNPGCDTNGFSAQAGWDPVTGLGTPNFASLLALAGL
ncbi:family S53 protease [Obba rivulosa]|uniref:tripeptidyl-peptidase II n=1 Tax=Obba rivulosa TaxID=1052685 RepID=A0A8E2DJV6_9APHY|nr:family S53 protease [Obba rivulosa]